jgi:hypothetical protein
MVVAAIVLVGLVTLDWLTWWTLLITLIVVPFVNVLLVGRTTRNEITIEKDR